MDTSPYGGSRLRQSFDVIIVGAGPAGSAAALQLAMHDPELARRLWERSEQLTSIEYLAPPG